jgi:DNA replication protein DnaC
LIPQKKLDFIKSKIKAKCECQGAGCKACYKKVSRVGLYAEAGIPVEYWGLVFKDFSGDPNFKRFVIKQIRGIDDVYEQGTSFAFVGNLGTGKTYAATSILKKALISGFSGMHTHMADIVRTVLSNSIDSGEYIDKLLNVDFLVIDEFDARWVFPSEKSERMFGSTLEHLLRCRFQNGMPTILCSNTQEIDEVLSDDFSRAFSSLRSKFVKTVYVAGKDFRKSGAK